MQPVGSFPRISTDETLRETASHGSADFPFQFYMENVWDFDFHCIDWHWHPEVEMLYVQTGTVVCSVGGRQHTLKAGSGMFINSRVVHRFEAASSAQMPNFLFLPSLLAPQESRIYQQYVQPLLHSGLPCIVLDPQVDWQAHALTCMQKIFAMHEDGAADAWRIFRTLVELWEVIAENAALCADHTEKNTANSMQHRLQIMLQYIHDHYRRDVTLKEIADSVYISKSSALQIFHDGIRMSPIAYLIRHRLKCASRLLLTTEKSVGVIAEECGFKSTGYFCRKFRELFEMSPMEYKRRPASRNSPDV